MTARLNVSLLIGMVLVGTVVLAGAISLVWTPQDFATVAIAERFKGPSLQYWLGTDQLGRDVLTQLMVGARNSLTIALVAVGIGGLIGAGLGVLAAARGGLIEEAVMRLADFSFAFPALLFAIMLASAFGPSLNNAVIAIAFINIPVFTRVACASAKQIWSRDYVLAARASSRSTLAITLDHILPNIAAVVIVQATIDFAGAILVEAALSYLGLGVQPPQPSWGRMLSEAQTLLYMAPQLAILPGLCIVAAVLGFNLLGDGMRDLADPRLTRGRS
jgi:peptide/nickel transport system permease protein